MVGIFIAEVCLLHSLKSIDLNAKNVRQSKMYLSLRVNKIHFRGCIIKYVSDSSQWETVCLLIKRL